MRSHFFAHAAKALRYALSTGMFGSCWTATEASASGCTCVRSDAQQVAPQLQAHIVLDKPLQSLKRLLPLVYLAGTCGDCQRPSVCAACSGAPRLVILIARPTRPE